MSLTSSEDAVKASYDFWTTEHLIDELAFHLSSFNSCIINESTHEIHITNKYHDQAEWMSHRINVWKPTPEFVINVSDLTTRLKKELKEISSSPETLNYVVTQAVARIFEAVNFELYHKSGIAGKLRWRLEP
jgi:hypothetical protein